MAGEFSEKRLDSLDQIRALAIMAVVINHGAYGWLPGGGIGVGIFFALSGFLIGSKLLESGGTIQGAISFLIHRIFRIYPIYLFALIVVAYSLPIRWPEKSTEFFALLPSLLTMTGLSTHMGFAINVTWTLHIEIAFYLVAPIACLLLSRKLGLALLSVVLIVAGLLPTNSFWLHWMGAIGLGSLLAVVWPHINSIPARNTWLLVYLPSIAGICILFYFPPHP